MLLRARLYCGLEEILAREAPAHGARKTGPNGKRRSSKVKKNTFEYPLMQMARRIFRELTNSMSDYW